MTRFTVGQILTFTRDLAGVCTINKGDTAVYIGGSQVWWS